LSRRRSAGDGEAGARLDQSERQGAADHAEHEHVLEAVQRQIGERPEKMRQRRETVAHPFGTIKARMGATHFLMKTLPRVATEMALHVLAYKRLEHRGAGTADRRDADIDRRSGPPLSPREPASATTLRRANMTSAASQRFHTTKTIADFIASSYCILIANALGQFWSSTNMS
jgi:hypothetical protein